MSDLGPFVASALPDDRVVATQQTQIHGLQQQVHTLNNTVGSLERQLQERNPKRSIKIVTTGQCADTILAADEWNAETAQNEYTTHLFADHADVHSTVQDFLKARLVIDDVTALEQLGESLRFTTMRFAFCGMIELEYLYIRATFSNNTTSSRSSSSSSHPPQTRADAGGVQSMQDDHDQDDDENQDDDDDTLFCVHLYMAPVTQEEYCAATGAVPSTFCSTGCIHTRDETERELPLSALQALAHKPIKLAFDDGQCQCRSEFLFDHLNVPYVP